MSHSASHTYPGLRRAQAYILNPVLAVAVLATFTQLLQMWKICGNLGKMRNFHINPEPFLQSVHDPVYVRLFIQSQYSYALALLASLVPHDSVVLLIVEEPDADGDFLAGPPCRWTGFVGTAKGAHDVCVVVANGVLILAFFVKVDGKAVCFEALRNLIMEARIHGPWTTISGYLRVGLWTWCWSLNDFCCVTV